MFYHYRHHNHCTHGFLFILSLIGAFFLGKHCEAHGYTLMSQWCGCSDADNNSDTDMSDMNMTNDSTPSYPR